MLVSESSKREPVQSIHRKEHLWLMTAFHGRAVLCYQRLNWDGMAAPSGAIAFAEIVLARENRSRRLIFYYFPHGFHNHVSGHGPCVIFAWQGLIVVAPAAEEPGGDQVARRSEARRVGKECVSTFRSRWLPCN